VAKHLKTAAELLALLNAELRKYVACEGVSVDAVAPVADDRVDFTWSASVLRKSAVRVLQQRYDLAPEE
jgi:hypothetical protein